MSISAATGLSYGQPTAGYHVERAVARALKKAGLSQANAVLLFLTEDYAGNPDAALRIAARTSGCTQIVGCTGPGLLTEEEWVLDASGAAALVLGGPIHCLPPQRTDGLRISFCSPDEINGAWLNEPVERIGAIAADSVGDGPYGIWQGGRVARNGISECVITGVDHRVFSSRGFKVLSQPHQVAKVKGHDILEIGERPALDMLRQSLPESKHPPSVIPLHMLMCGITYGDPENAIRLGRYRLNHILGTNRGDESITLADPIRPGEHLFWAIRDKLAAEFDFRQELIKAQQSLQSKPDFVLLLPCVSRGPWFYGKTDRDLDIVKERFPAAPIIGIYNNGQIFPAAESNRLLHYSTVASLFSVRS